MRAGGREVTTIRDPQGDLRPLEFAEGYALVDKRIKERLLADMKAAGVKVYRIAGREFVDERQWQATLRKLAVEVGSGR
jgi:hypothetical protein